MDANKRQKLNNDNEDIEFQRDATLVNTTNPDVNPMSDQPKDFMIGANGGQPLTESSEAVDIDAMISETKKLRKETAELVLEIAERHHLIDPMATSILMADIEQDTTISSPGDITIIERKTIASSATVIAPNGDDEVNPIAAGKIDEVGTGVDSNGSNGEDAKDAPMTHRQDGEVLNEKADEMMGVKEEGRDKQDEPTLQTPAVPATSVTAEEEYFTTEK